MSTKNAEAPCSRQAANRPEAGAPSPVARLDLRRKYDRVNRLRWSHRRAGIRNV